MDRLNYPQIIQEILKKHYHYHSQDSRYENDLILDTERHHYLIVSWRWEKGTRDYGCGIHVDIKDGKFWIHQDFTEVGIAQELVELGVPKSDIVLASRAPIIREMSGFAVN
jgi:hypothetical protein